MLPVLGGIVSAVLLGACEEFDVDYGAANAVEGHPNSSDTPALSAEDCQHQCGDDAGCFFYTYRALEGRCHKKRDVIKRAPNQFWDMAPGFPTRPVPAHGSVSGPKACKTFSGFDLADFEREVKRLHRCEFAGAAAIAARLEECRKESPFAHWQVSHAGSSYMRTYPRKQWEPCCGHGRTCRCYTTIRYGHASGSWAHLNVSNRVDGTKCVAQSFPGAGGRSARSNACECLTSDAELAASGRSTFLSVTMDRASTGDPCEHPLAGFSEILHDLSYGWGETAVHVALGLTGHCFPALPRWTSIASWKQDNKGYRLPCDSLTGFPFEEYGDADNYGLVYTQRINHWRWMPMNISADVRDAVHAIFGVRPPASLAGGPRGNPDVPRWAKFGWSHPCCQYMVLTKTAHASYAKFFVLITLHIAKHASTPSAAAAYCFLWSQGGCIPRWYGYIGEAVFILWTYYTQRMVPLTPGASKDMCLAHRFTSEHALYGLITHADIHAAFDRYLDENSFVL
ncbi:hypothetical protein DIPPA_07746 [Diplonema papillatum]|nr:hypothetical protein DIPPA_07746 [Diplonema papillatum]